MRYFGIIWLFLLGSFGLFLPLIWWPTRVGAVLALHYLIAHCILLGVILVTAKGGALERRYSVHIDYIFTAMYVGSLMLNVSAYRVFYVTNGS